MTSEPSPTPKAMLWTGYVLSALPVLMLIMSAIMKLTKNDAVIEGFSKFGYDESVIVTIGIVELVCTFIYAFPKTAVLGAILLTGYLGGAVATHVRVSDPFFGPLIPGVLLWLGLVLRDERLRSVLPWRM